MSLEPLLGPVTLADHHLRTLDWVICGGETGPKARPMHPDWARSLRNQCAAAGVPFFFKGWGEYLPVVTFGKVDSSEALRAVPPDYLPERFDQEKWRHFNNYTLIDDGHGKRKTWMLKCGKKLSGRLLDGVEHNERPW